MKKSILLFLALFIAVATNCQTKEPLSKFNFDFEIVKNGKPVGWENFGDTNYNLSLDSTIVKSGKYSAAIEFKGGEPGYNAWSFRIPDNYPGKKITLTGYIKTENVTDVFAGLLMRIDPSIAFDNMYENGVKGTTDWTKYEITLEMNPEKTTQIVVGGLLVGKGKMWIDDISVSIDGKDVKELKPFVPKLLPAQKDKEFDNGSQIATLPVDKSQIENMKTLGLIWGFLKYYHPNIAKGEYNWDYELFRVLPKVLNAKNKKNRDEILIKWIDSLGEFPANEVANTEVAEVKETEAEGADLKIGGVNETENTTAETNTTKAKEAEVKMVADLDWIRNSNFSDDLTTLLLRVKNGERPQENYYIGLQPGIGNPKFKNENAYSSMKYPDAGFRLLALYRYWNIIQYYFPYKYLIEEDWKSVLEEFIPKVISANNETDYTLTVLELIGRVHDTHANIYGGNSVLNNYRGLRFAAAELTFIEDKAVVTGFYDEKLGKETELQIGDIVLGINNKPIDEIIKERLKHTPASNYSTKLRNVAGNLLRSNDSIINIEFIRNGKAETKILKTFNTKEINIYSKYTKLDSCFKFINEEIAYLYLGSIKSSYLPTIFEKIKDTKGLIIDLRAYPSEFVVFSLGNYLMPKKTEFVKFSIGNIEQAGLFTLSQNLSVGADNKEYYKGKIIILINEHTQSQAEYTTMAFRVNPNATVIGCTTAGADGNVSQFYLPGGIITMITGIGIYYPDGKETQRIGIVPDIELRPTIQGIKEGRDELLEKAIKVINE